MTTKDDMTRALDAGRNARIGDQNPYTGQSLILAQLWRRGYKAMLDRSWYTSPHRRDYLQARTDTTG